VKNINALDCYENKEQFILIICKMWGNITIFNRTVLLQDIFLPDNGRLIDRNV